MWLPNKVNYSIVKVTEGTLLGPADVLIGMDIICTGDFAVTNPDNKTNFSFRYPSIERIDFVKQQPDQIKMDSQSLPKVGRNDLCPCGSGEKYKRCHGR